MTLTTHPAKPTTPTAVTDDLSLLFGLTAPSAREVVGRAGATISPEIQKLLAKLAAGRCTDEERRELIRLLEHQPDLIPVLVREIRILRESPK
jgi:hypothetical protein